MKKLITILPIILTFVVSLTFVGCDSNNKDAETTTEVTFKEPTVSVSESVTFSFKDKTSTTKKKTTVPSTTKKKSTQVYTTTEYYAPTTEYNEYTEYTEYYETTTQYYEPDTEAPVGYIDYSEASSRYFDESDVAGLSADTVQSVINDMYAHHGYIFQTKSIQEYYESQSWYNGTVNSQSEAEASFNDYERYNKDFLANYR
ncbi:MAG: YARHG domain-containing protein [Ruminococcus sp.]|nr:YARHG domain-containing protein [Ruminococcus sp.]